jgi:hypothetical protein
MSDTPMDQDVEDIVKQLSSRKQAERDAAENKIRQLGSAAVQDLLSILVRERAARSRKRKLWGAVIICYVVLLLASAILSRNFSMLGSVGSMTGLIVALFAATQTQRNVARLLTEIEDLRVVGALAEALEFQDQKVGELAESSLISLLPRLKASDAGLLDAQQRNCLHRALSRKNSNLVVAILQSLEQIGDAEAVPYVQKLADGHGLAARDVQIRTAAQHCLPYLQQLAEEQRVRQTLLRASDVTEVPIAAPDTLLRPAAGVTVADPQELLRATIATEPSTTAISTVETIRMSQAAPVRPPAPQSEEIIPVLRVGQN